MINSKKVEKKQVEPKKGVGKSLTDIFNGNFLNSEGMLNLLPFIFFLTFLALFYIANGYYAENKVREINNLGNELKELRSEYITTKSELMFKSKQSEVARSLSDYGIKESVVPPKKIEIESKN
jgi:hypothetical protein